MSQGHGRDENIGFSYVKRANRRGLGGIRGPEPFLRKEALPEYFTRWALPQTEPPRIVVAKIT